MPADDELHVLVAGSKILPNAIPHWAAGRALVVEIVVGGKDDLAVGVLLDDAARPLEGGVERLVAHRDDEIVRPQPGEEGIGVLQRHAVQRAAVARHARHAGERKVLVELAEVAARIGVAHVVVVADDEGVFDVRVVQIPHGRLRALPLDVRVFGMIGVDDVVDHVPHVQHVLEVQIVRLLGQPPRRFLKVGKAVLDDALGVPVDRQRELLLRHQRGRGLRRVILFGIGQRRAAEGRAA